MKSHASAAFMAIVVAMGFGSGAVLANGQPALQPIQYDRYPDQRPDGYYPQQRSDPYYPGQRPDGYYPDPRDRYADRSFPRWRPGQVIPAQFLDYVVEDWEERGLQRPPGGHRWVRVGQQFILVRDRDQMISRTINFD